MAVPDLTLFYMSIYGGFGYDWAGFCDGYLGLAAGVPQAGNPPYTVTDFFAFYPKWLGPVTLSPGVLNGTTTVTGVPDSSGMNPGNMIAAPGIPAATILTGVATAPIDFTGTLTAGSRIVTAVSSVAGLVVGQPISSVLAGIPGCTKIQAFDGTAMTVTLSNAATVSGVAVALVAIASTLTLSQAATTSGAVTLSVYEAPAIPLMVVQAFLNLANASLMSSRWRETWKIAMGWYIAHFLTLYEQSDGVQSSAPGAIVTTGLERGLLVSKTVDGVSGSYQSLVGLENWAAWTKTTYGTQLATMARLVGSGPAYWR